MFGGHVRGRFRVTGPGRSPDRPPTAAVGHARYRWKHDGGRAIGWLAALDTSSGSTPRRVGWVLAMFTGPTTWRVEHVRSRTGPAHMFSGPPDLSSLGRRMASAQSGHVLRPDGAPRRRRTCLPRGRSRRTARSRRLDEWVAFDVPGPNMLLTIAADVLRDRPVAKRSRGRSSRPVEQWDMSDPRSDRPPLTSAPAALASVPWGRDGGLGSSSHGCAAQA